MRGQGWKYGSGFVDGIFPVLSPIAQEILNFVQKEKDVSRIWYSLDTLPPTNTTWDDLINIAVRLRLNKQWDPIIVVYTLIFIVFHFLCDILFSEIGSICLFYQMCEWMSQRSTFKADVICYNLLIEAYGQKLSFKKAESIYLELVEARCIPTQDTYALLVKAYCKSRKLEHAEAVFAEMRRNGFPPSMPLMLYIQLLIL